MHGSMSRCLRTVVAGALALIACSQAAAATPAAWTVDDLILVEKASDWAVSPDGRHAAWSQSRVEKIDDEEKRVADIWLVEIAGGEPRQMTRAAASVGALAFSPDGRHLAFLSSRPFPPDRQPSEDEAMPQIWAIAVDGGEAFPVSALDRPVLQYGWLDDERLVAVAEESADAWESGRKEASDPTRIVDDAERTPPIRLFAVDLEGEVERLSTDRDWIDQLAVSPDGRRAVVTAQQSLSYAFDSRVPPKTFLIDLSTGEREELLADSSLLVVSPRWALDGSGFYFIDLRSNHPLYRTATVSELHFFDLEQGRAHALDLAWPAGLGGDYAVVEGGVIALLADGVRYRPARFDRASGERQDLEGTHVRNVEDWTVARDGRTMVYCSSSATGPPQCWSARLEGAKIVAERQITKLNPSYAEKPTGRVEVIRWRGARGDEVEGLLHFPLDGKDGERRPLVVDIHGGPASADRDRWDQSWSGPNILWRQRGAFVLQVNYHGSSGYGLEWVESIVGHYYDHPVADIEAGVDHLIDSGRVDPERLAVSGWSNGGILAADLITRTSRYDAAIVGAADVEWISDWANVDFGASFNNYYFGGPPWEATDAYIEASPFFRLGEVETPTLIHTGTEDRNVPPHQSWSLFRAMQQIGKAPARLALYPGEPHGLQRIAHQRRKLEEDLAWFDHYVFETRERLIEYPVVPEDSRLGALFVRQRAAADAQGRFGVVEDGVLIPETVLHQGLQLGRFEVTRAQYAAFSGVRVPALEANLPQVASAGEAQAYARWLSEKTGRGWRLPSLEESEKLKVETQGNVLDHWVGYTANPDDARRLAERLQQLEGPAPLLLPVGSFQPSGGVFDLDGNVAEWAIDAGGEARAVGPSAERSTDARQRGGVDPAYTGFRLITE